MKNGLNNITLGGLLLAGGQGSRMGYCNKGLMPLAEQPMAKPIINVLKSTCHYVAISANQNLDSYQAFQVPVWPDASEWQNIGPLGGLATALTQFPNSIQTVQVLPCDTPFITAEIVYALSEALTNHNTSAVFAQSPRGPHPTICQLNINLMDSLSNFLSQAHYGFYHWLQSIQAQSVFFKDESLFTNINSLKELNQYNYREN